MIENYLTELLSVKVLIKDKEDKSSVYNKIVCMSLQSIKYLCKLGFDNQNEAMSKNQDFTKYIKRIYEDNKDNELFKPKLDCFKKICGDNDKSPESKYFVIFQDDVIIVKPESKKNYNEMKDYMKLLISLLPKIRLEAYYDLYQYGNNYYPERSMIQDFLIKLNDYPRKFLEPKHNFNDIYLMTKTLIELVNNGCSLSEKEIKETTEMIRSYVENTRKIESEVSYHISNIIKTMKNYIRRLKTSNLRYRTKIIPSLIAKNIIDNENFIPFSIDKIETKVDSKKSIERETSLKYLTNNTK